MTVGEIVEIVWNVALAIIAVMAGTPLVLFFGAVVLIAAILLGVVILINAMEFLDWCHNIFHTVVKRAKKRKRRNPDESP